MALAITDKSIRGVCLSFLASALIPVQSHASLLGDSVQVAIVTPADTSIDTTTVIPGREIVAGDSSEIGGIWLLPDEYIDIGDVNSLTSSIIYHAQWAEDPATLEPVLFTIAGQEYASLGYEDKHKLVFSGLDFNNSPISNAILSAVTVSLQDMIIYQTQGTSEEAVYFDANSVTLNLSHFLVRYLNDNDPDFGTITLNLQFAAPVPLPGGLVLWASGLALLSGGLFGKRQKSAS